MFMASMRALLIRTFVPELHLYCDTEQNIRSKNCQTAAEHVHTTYPPTALNRYHSGHVPQQAIKLIFFQNIILIIYFVAYSEKETKNNSIVLPKRPPHFRNTIKRHVTKIGLLALSHVAKLMS